MAYCLLAFSAFSEKNFSRYYLQKTTDFNHLFKLKIRFSVSRKGKIIAVKCIGTQLNKIVLS
mgnify:CR=1 FL=1